MKKLFILLVLLPLISFGQDPKVDGLGPFKVGITDTSIIQTICEELGASVKKVYNFRSSLNPNSPIVEFGFDTVDCTSAGFDGPYSTMIRSFMLSDYKLLGKYKIGTLSLSFLNGILYKIQCLEPSALLVTDLETKYGKGSTGSFKTSCNCKVGTEDFDFKCDSYYRSWRNDKIRMSSIISERRKSDGCDKEHSWQLLLVHTDLDEDARAINDAGRKKCEEKERQKRLKTLDKL